MVDEIRQTPEIRPLSTLERGVRIERRRARREPPKTLEDAHAIVQAIAKRQVEDDPRVKRWRVVKRVFYLLALIGAYLFYYFIDKLNDVISLPSIGF